MNLYIFLYIDNIPRTLYNGAITTSSVLLILRAKLLSKRTEEEYQDRGMQQEDHQEHDKTVEMLGHHINKIHRSSHSKGRKISEHKEDYFWQITIIRQVEIIITKVGTIVMS